MNQASFTFIPYSANLLSTQVPCADLNTCEELLALKIQQSGHFFNGFGLIADLSLINNPSLEWLEALKALLQKYQFILVGVCNAPFSREALLSVGLCLFAEAVKKVDEQPAPELRENTPPTAMQERPSNVSGKTQIIRGNVRSGQRIYAQDCDLIVIGTVSTGAEVIADGNIHILGTLRGRAFAGASGDVQAHIYCQTIREAQLIAIAGNYYTMEQLEPYDKQKNCLISLNNDETMLIVGL